ncbi:Ran-binding protein 17 [Zancudomyces culisetae]|uniref:Ran-binding protein 17 n=1 Tax=Zancudomyces culisetae TaxID=1213189 RepID=A0A1R1PWI9_ZANCU|nr:Ran-binding protein 17 [Zancudomyces culisetae]|eukprot:OMH85365.1 Ran-binding protein 17 [Zancudomyces culisetae]
MPIYNDPALGNAYAITLEMLRSVPIAEIMAYPKFCTAALNMLEVLLGPQNISLLSIDALSLNYILNVFVGAFQSADSAVSSPACSALDRLVTFTIEHNTELFIHRLAIGNRDQEQQQQQSQQQQQQQQHQHQHQHQQQQHQQQQQQQQKATLKHRSRTGLVPSSTSISKLPTNCQDIASLFSQLAEVQRRLLILLYNIILFEDRKNDWSFSRPLYSLAVLHKQTLFDHSTFVVQHQQPIERRELLVKLITPILTCTEFSNLLTSSRDKFTQATTQFKKECIANNVSLIVPTNQNKGPDVFDFTLLNSKMTTE